MALQPKVAGWYWITSAILTPFVLGAWLVTAYYNQEIQSYRAEGNRLVQQIENQHQEFEPLRNHMLKVAEATGWNMGDPVAADRVASQNLPRPTVFEGEERNQPVEKRSPLLNAYIDAEGRFYGATADDTGYVEEYMAAREWLNAFELRLKNYIYFKSYQYYTVKSIDLGDGTGVVVAEQSLARKVTELDGMVVPTEEALSSAAAAGLRGDAPLDRVMQKPTKITLELVFRRQTQLVRDLVSANLHQYTLLYSDVSGEVDVMEMDAEGKLRKVGTARVGYEGEQAALKNLTDQLALLNRRVGERKDVSVTKLEDASRAAEDASRETEAGDARLQTMYVATEGQIEVLKTTFEREKLTHEGDAQKFEDLVRNLPRLKIPQKLEKSDPDGEISYSDYARGVIHVNLGSADGIRNGQRFEIWRLHGFEKDEFVGVVEIVRMLSAHFSLATVLTLSNPADPVRKGDKVVSQIWQDGEFLTVALHGDYEPPNEAYSKARLVELLKQAGVKVVDKVQPGTDIVILGSNLLGDEWYRRARNDLRFETLKEDDIRIYVDPR